MQAITTKFIPATNFKPSRIKAECARGFIIVSYDSIREDSANDTAKHTAVADALVAKFIAEDSYGGDAKTNPWGAMRVVGQMKGGNYAHVFCH